MRWWKQSAEQMLPRHLQHCQRPSAGILNDLPSALPSPHWPAAMGYSTSMIGTSAGSRCHFQNPHLTCQMAHHTRCLRQEGLHLYCGGGGEAVSQS